MTRMSDAQEKQRQALENALFRLARAGGDLELDVLRLEQALRRYGGAGDLLRPVVDDLRRFRGLAGRVESELATIWQAAPWKN